MASVNNATDLEFYFRVCLRGLIVKDAKDNQLIKAYELLDPDEQLRQELKSKVIAAMASPKETGDYEGKIEMGFVSEEIALNAVEINGLIALTFLGEKEIIPTLISRLQENKGGDTKRKMVGILALCYLTGQRFSDSKFLTLDKQLTLLEEWWNHNKYSFLA